MTKIILFASKLNSFLTQLKPKDNIFNIFYVNCFICFSLKGPVTREHNPPSLMERLKSGTSEDRRQVSKEVSDLLTIGQT